MNIEQQPLAASSFSNPPPDSSAGQGFAALGLSSEPSEQTILVVDDEMAVRELVQEMLQHMGFTVLTADGLDQALEITTDHPHLDLLLSDVMMPGFNGPMVAEHILKLYPDLPVMFMSGYCDNNLLQSNVGTVRLLTKPFSVHDLESAVKQAIATKV